MSLTLAENVAAAKAGGEESAHAPWLAEIWHSAGPTVASAVLHMTVLIVLALVLGTSHIVQKGTSAIFEVEEFTVAPDLMRIELDPHLALVTQPTQATYNSSAVIGAAAGTIEGGGGGGGGGSASGSGAGPGGSGGGLALDRSVFAKAGKGIGTGIGEVTLDLPTGSKLIAAVPDGLIGDGRSVVGSYQEALDRLTQEFVWMLDKGKVLVIWAFDESESMKDDQKEIRDRIEHVYDQLGLLGSGGGGALETAVVSFGEKFAVRTSRPTDDRAEIRSAIDSIPLDRSGKEIMCSALLEALEVHRGYAQRSRRQLALVVVTDESGDRNDNSINLERLIAEAKAARSKIFVLGREAVFGYPFAHIRWVHPQTLRVHWLPIDRGPETAFVEQLQTDGFHRRYDAHPSGFGPFECSRMGRETGGIFFMLPSLETNLVRGQKRHYDMEAPYFPDLRSRAEVKDEIDGSPLRTMLEKVIYDLNPYNPEAQKIIEMRVEFSTDYDALARQIRHEQGKAIVYLQYLAKAEETVGKMDLARKQEPSPRWQANYDLLYAQLIAYQARMYEYGAYLEEFLQNVQAYVKNPANPKNEFKPPPATKKPNLFFVHWDIRTRQRTITGDKVQPYIERATAMFKQVMADHPYTPWAARAEIELRRGFGVELVPDYDIKHPEPSGNPIPVPKL